VNLRHESLDLVYASVFGGDEPGAASRSRVNPSPPPSDHYVAVTISDDEIIELACKKPRTGDKFRSLWDGNWNDHYNSASEADSSVVFTLAYYTKDAQQIDRIFRRSALIRPKWDQQHGSETYGATTISKALSKVTKQFTPKQKRPAAQRNQPPANLGFPKSAIDWDFKSDQTENAMAVEFIDANQTNLRYVPSWKKWLAWDGKRWKVDVDQNKYFLNLQNGTFDLSTLEFRDHRQSDSITQIANVAFDPKAQCPKWRAFIDLIFGSDDEAKRYIQALLGYSCSGDVGEHILPTAYSLNTYSLFT